MVFSSATFLMAFLPITLVLYFLTPSRAGKNVMLLAQCIQLAVAGLLELAVALALFRQLQLQRLTVAPELIQWANLCRDLGT